MISRLLLLRLLLRGRGGSGRMGLGDMVTKSSHEA